MKINFYHVDAFTNSIFKGNPAAVCILLTWPEDDYLPKLAKENNLPVTAFLVRVDDQFEIRWFTPEGELDLCGHGSLAAAYVIFNYIETSWSVVNFQSQQGSLQATRKNNLISLNFPEKIIEPFNSPLLEEGLGLKPQAIYRYKNERCLAVFNTESEVQQLNPNMQILKNLEQRAVVVTAPGIAVDFVSRTFYPSKKWCEDAATGASHCMLVPYWAEKIKKRDLHSYQVSERGGEFFCHYGNKRVIISGQAVLYLQGTLAIFDVN